MPQSLDLTSKLERLEALEDRLGVSLSSLSAFLDKSGADTYFGHVRGEMSLNAGTTLEEDLKLQVAAYDRADRIVGTACHWVGTEDFFALETFDILFQVPVSDIARIRIYPKKP